MLFIYEMSKGPKREPWETPDVTLKEEKVLNPLYLTFSIK